MNKGTNLNTRKATIRVAKLGMMAAISIVLVMLIHFPIFPALPFLEYDPGDVPILIGTFAFGPLGGLGLTAVVCVVQGVTVSAASGVYGIIMHVLATGALILVAGLIYRKQKTRKRAAIGLICGVIAMALIMIPANLFITPIFMGVPREAIVTMLPFIVGFNLIKGGINALITFFLYKRISNFLHR